MKIAIIVEKFPPKWLAGTEIATYNIARHIAMRGHEVHVVTSLDNGLPKESIYGGCYVHRIGWRKVRFLRFALFWVKALIILRKINPDMVHAQNIIMGGIGFLSRKFLRKPYIVWGQGSDVYLPWLFKKEVSKTVLKNANAVIALTEDMKREIKKICDRNIFVIPNGIDLKKFENLSRKEARSKLQIEEDEKIIIFVGTLRSVKGVKHLIQAMVAIGREDTRAKLMLVGNGKERPGLEELVKELVLERQVSFIGRAPNEDVPEYMVASDVFVLPSLSESFGIVNLEAMASGLPIVASKVGGLPEIVRDGKNGFLVEPKNPEQIAEKVLLLLGNDELRRSISEINKEKAKDYSWERVADRLEKVYSEVLNDTIASRSLAEQKMKERP